MEEGIVLYHVKREEELSGMGGMSKGICSGEYVRGECPDPVQTMTVPPPFRGIHRLR